MPRNRVLNWTMSLAETLAFGVTLVTVTLWVMTTFVEKTSAKEFSDSVDIRFSQMERRSDHIYGKIDKIEDDVAVIRGILEGQSRKKNSQ